MRLIACVTVLSVLFVGCSDEVSTPNSPKDMKVDLPSGDMGTDLGEDMPNTAPPVFSNLPATVTTNVPEPGSYQLALKTSSSSAQFALQQNGCPFDVVTTPQGEVSWTCSQAIQACTIDFLASIGEQQSQPGTLTIQCDLSAPIFTTTPQQAATEHETYRYDVSCTSSDGAQTTLTVDEADECGGTLEGNTYVWTPTETQGGSSCLIQLECAANDLSVSQSTSVAVTETNDSPQWVNLPGQTDALWGRMGSFTVEATDSDIPVQSIDYSITATTCSFSPTIESSTGVVTYTCSDSLETCTATIQADTDGVSAESSLTITCTNQPPVASNVDISPSIITLGTTLHCDYTYADANQDMDDSSIEWLVNGAVVGTGQGFSNYTALDMVTCRVTPSDTIEQGVPVDALAVQIPAGTQMSATSEHACAIRAGALYCWGRNNDGQLGQGHTDDVFGATLVPGMESGVTHVSAGSRQTCAVKSGAAYCWGENGEGELGDGTTTDRKSPVPVLGMDADVEKIATSYRHTCAIKSGALHCWGQNHSGQLGDGTTNDTTSPVATTGLSASVTGISVGSSYSCAISSGQLYCWGRGRSGQLGIGMAMDHHTPTLVPGMDSGITRVVTGINHTCAIKSEALYCWGSGSGGQIGHGSDPSRVLTPQLVLSSNVIVADAGTSHTCAYDGQFKCWGSNGRGAVGDMTTEERDTPTVVANNALTSVDSFALGAEFSCAVQGQDLECWGQNVFGALNQANKDYFSTTPVALNGLTTASQMSAYAGACAVNNGALHCWDFEQDHMIAQVGFTSGVTQVSKGYSHTCVIKSGALFCRGINTDGQLGDGTLIDRTDFVAVRNMGSGVTHVSAGEKNTCAVQNGALFCWGSTLLGNTNASATQTPTAVTSLSTGVEAVETGARYACAIQNGALFCWGSGYNGQLGVQFNNTGGRTTPTPVVGMSANVTKVAVARFQIQGFGAPTCAIQSGALHCWGYTGERATPLRNGPLTVPVPVPSAASGVTDVTLTLGHSCIVQNGAAKCTGGYNSNGTYGDGTTTPKDDYVQVVGLTSGVDFVSGRCAGQNGQIYCWGSNGYALLGFGTQGTQQAISSTLP